MAAERIVLVGRAGCHLCEDARAVVAQVAAETGATWREADVDADEDLHRRYTDLVPVVLLDGAEHDFGRVDAARLRSALAGGRWWRRR
ncbi:glutaredoxin family protein [Kineococcus sp. NUM-3379]